MIKVLVTGFGAFPGTCRNPSLALLAALHKRRMRLARLGIDLELRVLPVVYAGLGPRLAKLAGEIRPDAIIHFGLAGRRKIISVETRARNHVNLLHPDAAGARPPRLALLPSGPEIVKARVPAPQIVAALRQAGIASGLSNDAGNYLCNASFYHSLVAADATCIGFIHVPAPRRRMARSSPRQDSPRKDKRPRFADVVAAAEIALVIIARAVRQSS